MTLSGCGASNGFTSTTTSSGNGAVVLELTDVPPANVTILAAEVTLTGATLNPGNVSILSVPQTVELTKLQTDVAYLATATAAAGSYSSVTLTFANPMLTFENDTGSLISGSACVGNICRIAPTSSNLSVTINLTPALSLAAGGSAGILADVNLQNLLNATLGADFSAGVSVSQFTPAGTDAPAVGAEDVVGQVTAVNTAQNSFTLLNATSSYTLPVTSATTFFPVFPTNSCASPGFSCLAVGQILSVDIGILADGSAVARNVLFEDADSSDAEVEGIVTGFDAAAQTANIVTLALSTTVSGLTIGDPATVQYSSMTPFVLDYAHADNAAISTVGFTFAAPTDLTIGQQISVRRNATLSSGTQIEADRIELRSTRLTGVIQSLPSPVVVLGGSSPSFPSLFVTNGITTVQARTFPQTIFTGTGSSGLPITDFSQLLVNATASVRGPLFNLNGTFTIVTSKVVQR